jgi:hypothetical protein
MWGAGAGAGANERFVQAGKRVIEENNNRASKCSRDRNPEETNDKDETETGDSSSNDNHNHNQDNQEGEGTRNTSKRGRDGIEMTKMNSTFFDLEPSIQQQQRHATESEDTRPSSQALPSTGAGAASIENPLTDTL